MTDEELFNVMLHKAKTRRLIKALKSKHPDKWQRAYRNIAEAYEELRDRYVHKSFFNVGIYDPSQADSWPWHFHYEDGLYLSEKQHVCKMSKAAVFNSISEARKHFHTWSGNKKYKMEIIEFKQLVAVPASSSDSNESSWQTAQPRLSDVKS